MSGPRFDDTRTYWADEDDTPPATGGVTIVCSLCGGETQAPPGDHRSLATRFYLHDCTGQPRLDGAW